MLQPLEEQYQAEMGARLNPRQPSDPWVPMMPFYGAQPPGSFSLMPQSWQPEVADVPTQEWTPYSAMMRLIGGSKAKGDIAEAALDTTDFLPGGGPIGDILGFGGKMVGKGLASVPWGDVAKAIPEGTMAGLAGMFGSLSKKPLYKTDFVNPERVRTDHLTGWFGENIQVDIDDLKTLPGYKGEHTAMGSEYSQNLIENLSESMKKEGWSGDSVMVFVEKDGSVTIGEGNHRIQAALNAGLTEIPTEIKYFGNSNQNPNVWGRKYIDRYNPRKKPKLSRQDIISQGYYKRDDAGKVRYPDISQGYGDLVDINGQELASSLTPHEAAISIFDNLKQIPVEESWAGIPMQRQLRYIGDDNHTVIFSLSHDGKSLLVREGTHGGRANQLVRQGEIEEAGGPLQWSASDRGKEILKQRDGIAKAWIDHFLELPYVEKFRPEGTGGVLP